MACCLTAPIHYLNQCCLIISQVLWHSPAGNFTEMLLEISLKITNLRWQPNLPRVNEFIIYVKNHDWDHYPCTLCSLLSDCNSSDDKVPMHRWYLQVPSHEISSSNLTKMSGYQSSSPSYGHQCDMPYSLLRSSAMNHDWEWVLFSSSGTYMQ